MDNEIKNKIKPVINEIRGLIDEVLIKLQNLEKDFCNHCDNIETKVEGLLDIVSDLKDTPDKLEGIK